MAWQTPPSLRCGAPRCKNIFPNNKTLSTLSTVSILFLCRLLLLLACVVCKIHLCRLSQPSLHFFLQNLILAFLHIVKTTMMRISKCHPRDCSYLLGYFAAKKEIRVSTVVERINEEMGNGYFTIAAAGEVSYRFSFYVTLGGQLLSFISAPTILLYLKLCFLGDENTIKPEYGPSPLIQIRGRDGQKHTHTNSCHKHARATTPLRKSFAYRARSVEVLNGQKEKKFSTLRFTPDRT